jgi:hypothetical protein
MNGWMDEWMNGLLLENFLEVGLNIMWPFQSSFHALEVFEH